MGTLWSAFADHGGNHIGRYDHLHVRQDQDWDCGISNVHMALRFLRTTSKSTTTTTTTVGDAAAHMHSFYESNTPLWTIDMFATLVDCGVRHHITMYTTAMGIAPQHSDNEWYRKHLEKDRERVNRKFQRAVDEGWRVHEERLDLEQLCATRLAGDAPTSAAILLVCSNTLKAYPTAATRYAGHYIFVVGYDPRAREALYLDPSLESSEPQRAPLDALVAAAAAPGTDHDIIVIDATPAGS